MKCRTQCELVKTSSRFVCWGEIAVGAMSGAGRRRISKDGRFAKKPYNAPASSPCVLAGARLPHPVYFLASCGTGGASGTNM